MTKQPTNTKYFQYEQLNPKGKKAGDCVIRAISSALGQSWDNTFTELVKVAYHNKEMPNSEHTYTKYLSDVGYKKCKTVYREGRSRYTVSEFCEYLTKAGYRKPVLVHVKTHFTVLKRVNGQYKCFDSWNCTRYSVGIFFVSVDDKIE